MMLDNNTDIDHKICYREILARVLKRAGIEKDQLELACGSGGKTSWHLRVKIPEGPEAIVCKTIDEREMW